VKIKEVIIAINQMLRDGIIERYAIGGAVGATFYLEPVATLDVDIFVSFKQQAGSLLVSPQPIFDYLTSRGARVEAEYLVIAGWPVQFLPAGGALGEEALMEAAEFDVEGEETWVFTAEHLAALALQLGRAKDKARLLQFFETGALDADRFQAILGRHGLLEKWETFWQQFLQP
jgi:hypothetical protein